jgi:ABC-type phosphate transport system substrate-binding protein
MARLAAAALSVFPMMAASSLAHGQIVVCQTDEGLCSSDTGGKLCYYQPGKFGTCISHLGSCPCIPNKPTAAGSSITSTDYAGPLDSLSTPDSTPPSELSSFKHSEFEYFPVGSSAAQEAFANNDPSSFGSLGVGSSVDLAAIDGSILPGSPLYPPSAYPLLGSDGPYVQVPMLGLGVAMVGVDGGAFTGDGQLQLNSNALCGIFSGTLTTWDEVAKIPGNSVNGATGPLSVFYRSDSSYVTYLLSNTFKSVCTGSNSAFPNLAAAPTSNFSALFNASLPPNFIGEAGAQALASGLASSGSAIGYLTPDFTHLTEAGAARQASAVTSAATLYAAALESANGSYVTPTPIAIAAGLGHPGKGSVHINPPADSAEASDPLNWVPTIPTVTSGYPIVGYSSLIASSCYKTPDVAAGIVNFLYGHYENANLKILRDNGFVLPPPKFTNPIIATFLTNSAGYDLNISSPVFKGGVGMPNKTLCKGLPGR